MGRLSADFSGDVAIVTGAASGIGREITLRLARAGCSVHGFDVADPPRLELGPQVREPRFHRVDVRETDEVEEAVRRVAALEGRIDHLVNCAGINRDRVLWKLSDEDWQRVIDVDLGGAWRVLRAVARPMRERGHGRIVQIASINGLRGRFGQANYTAAKAGLVGLTRTAARELGPRGITVNAVAPGAIETPMTEALSEEFLTRSLNETALGRLGRPADVAEAVLYLLSENAAHVTGAILVVDGGQTA